MRIRRLARAAAVPAAALVLALAGCGGGGTVTPPTTLPPPTPPPPQVVAQGNGFPLEAETIGFVTFTTTLPGALEATVDWTFAANDVDVLIARAPCSFEQLVADQCTVLAFATSETTKPEKARAEGTTPGSYVLFVVNFGPGDESVSFQVVLTPSAAAGGPPTASGRGAPAGPFALKRPLRGLVELRR
jgi:hypothetical protein